MTSCQHEQRQLLCPRCRYLPGEFYFSALGKFYQATMFITILVSLIWFVVNTLMGIYANIPFVTEACLMQVATMEPGSG